MCFLAFCDERENPRDFVGRADGVPSDGILLNKTAQEFRVNQFKTPPLADTSSSAHGSDADLIGSGENWQSVICLSHSCRLTFQCKTESRFQSSSTSDETSMKGKNEVQDPARE